MNLSPRDIDHVFEKLRSGLVPERGIEAFAVGIDTQLGELRRQLKLVQHGEGATKFLRGGYGCGKTFMARMATLEAQKQNFATSFVVVSDNDLKFQNFNEVYRRVVTELSTTSCPRGALGDILDRWIGRIEEGLINAGADEDAPEFDAQVQSRLESELGRMTGGKAPADFVRVVQTTFELKQAGKLAEANALLSWLSGSRNIDASVKRLAKVKGEIGSQDAMAYLRGIVEIIHAAEYAGMLIIIDEAETILRMRKDSRHKSLNGIRQISDAAGSYNRLLWVFTGTPEFFDSRQGVAGLSALHDRIRFSSDGKFASPRQPQLLLKPFDRSRLIGVATKLRDLYPSEHAGRIESKISDGFIKALVDKVTEGFKGDVGMVPRQFLRTFVNCLDLVEEHEEYEPGESINYTPDALTHEEEAHLAGLSEQIGTPQDDELVPSEDAW